MIIIPIILIFVLLLLIFSSNQKEQFDYDDYLVQNYHKKLKVKERVVLVIEEFNNLPDLIDLIRNILKQTLRVDSLVIISSDGDSLKKVKLIHNTSIINKVGGLSICLKESGKDTIIIYIFNEGFKVFSNPNFLDFYLKRDVKSNGVIKTYNNFLKVSVDKVY